METSLLLELVESRGQTAPADWVQAALEASRQSISRGITEGSVEFARLTADHAREHHLSDQLVVALNNLGHLLLLHDQPYDALNALSEASILLEPSNLLSEKTRNFNFLGAVYQVLGSLENAHRHYEKALEMARSNQDPIMQARILNNMSLLLQQQKKFKDALFTIQQSEQIWREQNNPAMLCQTLVNKIGLELECLPPEDPALADHMQEVWQWLDLQDDIYQRIAMLQHEAVLCIRTHRPEQAIAAGTQALELSQAHQITDLEAHTHMVLGEVLHTTGRPLEALEHLQKAIVMFRELDYQESLLHPLKKVVDVLKTLRRFEEALQHHEELYQLDQEIRTAAATQQLEILAFQRKLEQSQHEAELERIRSEELEQLVQERTAELESAYLEMLERLAIAAEFRDSDTGEHTVRVGERAAEVARHLGMPEERVQVLRLAARLHDVGKIAISDTILHKPGKLTDEEYTTIKAHTLAGARMLSQAQSELIRMAETIALTHHEKWDGTGYPNGLKGEEIPLEGRIVAAVDVLDALLSERPYKEAWTLEAALHEIETQSGKHFDPRVVQVLLMLHRSDKA